MNGFVKGYFQMRIIKSSTPVFLSVLFFLYTFTLTGSWIFLSLNLFGILLIGFTVFNLVRIVRTISYLDKFLYRDNPLNTLKEMLKNVTAPNKNESHHGMVDDYYNQPKRWQGFMGDPQIRMLKDLIKILEEN